MQFTTLPGTGISVSRLCLGTMTFGSPVAEPDAIRLVHDAAELGVNFIDTANMYEGYNRFAGSAGGVAEEIVGKAVAARRADFVVATKLGMKVGDTPVDENTSPEAIRVQLRRSLRRINTDYIDLYYLHRYDPNTAPGEIARAIGEELKAGTIRAWGVSNYSAEQLSALLAAAREENIPLPSMCQPPLSLLNTGALDALLPLCAQEGIGVIPYQVLQGGILTGKYHAGQQPPAGSRAAEKPDWMKPMTDEVYATLARVEAEFKQIQDRIWEDYELTYAGAEPFRQADFKLSESEKRIAAIRQRFRAMGTVNVAAVDEYRRTCERVQELSAQRDDLLKAEADLQRIVEELEHKMEVQYRQQIALMNENFQRTFVRLFGGGKAELRLTDPKDALNCGIEVVAQPPGKKLQMLSLLSGGERALTAIAILFAILDLKPTPFCILDEIEAALDDANIDTYADYLKAYSANTQFIVITHRKGTMERCDSLYGVVMEEKGISKTVSVMLNEAV